MKTMKTSLLLFTAFLVVVPATLRAHDHYAVGIADTNGNGQADAGEPLAFAGASGTEAISHLLARPQGQLWGGYYLLTDSTPRTLYPEDGFTVIALSDGQTDDPQPLHAHTGAQIWMKLTAVAGPPGGQFGFWEADWAGSHQTPTVSFPANQIFAPYSFEISEPVDGIPAANQDPYGHIHGRAWTATKPGDYYLSFQLVDLSTSHNGGPWHQPSATYVYHFVAGPSFQPGGQPVPGAGYRLTWPSQMGTWDDGGQTGVVFTVQRSATLTAGSWQTLGTVTGTTDPTAMFTDPAPPTGRAFYRLLYDWSAP